MATTGSNYFQDYLRDYEELAANTQLMAKLLRAPKISKKKPLKFMEIKDAAQVDLRKSFRSFLCETNMKAFGRTATSVEPKLLMRSFNQSKSEQQNQKNSILYLNNE